MAALSLSRILAYWADQQPDRVAVSHEGREVTFARTGGEFEPARARL